jgi:hypothetical protein
MTRAVTVEVFDPASTRVSLVMTADPRYIESARTAEKTSFLLLHVLSLLGKQCVNRIVPYQRLLYCRLFTQFILGNGSTCHDMYVCMYVCTVF